MGDLYDVAIVGAGPAGATCAWYLAQHDIEVLLLEKAKFPRDKFCGDAVIPRAQRHLRRMGVLQQLIDALTVGFIWYPTGNIKFLQRGRIYRTGHEVFRS